jgi:4-hydroxybenzoate polyprenyltransferase
MTANEVDNGISKNEDKDGVTTWRDYVSMLRPVTLLQAVGALLVGRLVVAQGLFVNFENSGQIVMELCAMISVFLSYGAGMVANDCVDATIDAQAVSSEDPISSSNSNSNNNQNQPFCYKGKQSRPMANGRLQVSQGWKFVAVLSFLSLIFSQLGVSTSFTYWCASNWLIMILYSFGLQRFLIIKNLVVGWLSVSPLIGATLVSPAVVTSNSENIVQSLLYLAATGFPLAVAREILKDIQDVDLDLGHKRTLPLVFGVRIARGISFGLLWTMLFALMSTTYRTMFASSYPFYSLGWLTGTYLIGKANLLVSDPDQQQALVKKSIYALLGGLILSLLTQTQT